MLAPSQIRFTTMAVVLSSLAVAALVGLALVALAELLLWMVVALLLAMILNPLVDHLSTHAPRWLAVTLVMAGLLALVAGLMVLIVPPFVAQARSLAVNAPALLERLVQSQLVERLDGRFGMRAGLERFLKNAPDAIAGAATPFLRFMESLVRVFYAGISIFFLTLFMLLNGPAALRGGEQLLKPNARGRAEKLFLKISQATSRYAIGTAALALLAGAVATLALLLIGVPYFLPLGASLVVLDLVPFVGAISGGVLLTLVAGATVGWLRALVLLAVFSLYQMLEGHLLLPLVHRRTVRLSALGVAVALLVGFELAGIVGVLLATPIAGALRIVARELLSARALAPGREGPAEAAAAAPPVESPRLGPNREEPVRH